MIFTPTVFYDPSPRMLTLAQRQADRRARAQPTGLSNRDGAPFSFSENLRFYHFQGLFFIL